MKLYLLGHDYRYAAEQMLATLFPDQRPEYPEGKPEGDRAELSLFEGEKNHTAVCRFHRGKEVFSGRAAVAKARIESPLARQKYLQRIVKLSFYRAALRAGVQPPIWGALTGIRPGKLLSNLLETGMSDRQAVSAFMRENFVSQERALLCLHTAQAGLACQKSLAPRDVCLYVGIPFCPTRCSYCSFVSQSVQKSMGLIPAFLEALYREIDETARLMRACNLRPIAVYLGGGTPTTLSPEQLEALCTRLEAAFDFSAVREYTVEAGRPDTITAEKLAVLKKFGVDRVSVNPQSMDDEVLAAVGRKHTAQDVLTALDLVHEAGGFAVNMDLIAGLPLDSPQRLAQTLERVLKLRPENITVHTLALKKGSRIMLGETPRPSAEAVGQMINAANAGLFAAGYRPYYLYRQKYMSGGFENVGWQRDGTENIYNICIMEELCSIISLGGGASTKLCLGEGRIERVFNPKYPTEYIGNIEKVLASKAGLQEFLCTAAPTSPAF